MTVFICWAGSLSKKVAQRFYEYLELSPLHVEVRFSPEGIASGERWPGWLSQSLESAHCGWLFMTRENLENKWIHFEAGSLGKDVEKSRVCPILIDITNAELRPPLSHFQARQFNEDEIFKAIQDLNAQLGNDSVREDTLKRSFERDWEDISATVVKAIKSDNSISSHQERSDREILEEVLAEVRRTSKWQEASLDNSREMMVEMDHRIRLDRDFRRMRERDYILDENSTHTSIDGRKFNPGDQVFHKVHRKGTYRGLDLRTGRALVVFDNSTTSSPDPIPLDFDELMTKPK